MARRTSMNFLCYLFIFLCVNKKMGERKVLTLKESKIYFWYMYVRKEMLFFGANFSKLKSSDSKIAFNTLLSFSRYSIILCLNWWFSIKYIYNKAFKSRIILVHFVQEGHKICQQWQESTHWSLWKCLTCSRCKGTKIKLHDCS